MNEQMLIIGHRGACGHEPENTLRSFAKALELGVDAVELDVQLCRTGELVVIHDDTVDRTTNGHGRITELSFAELRALDAGKSELVPTLSEVIELVDKRVPINIELKAPDVAKPVSDLITAYENKGWGADRFIVSSFDHPELTRFHALQPNIKIGALIGHLPIDHAKYAADLGAWSASCNREFLSTDFIKDAHTRGLKVLVFTVNDERDIRNMITLDVDGIFTNFPDRARVIRSVPQS